MHAQENLRTPRSCSNKYSARKVKQLNLTLSPTKNSLNLRIKTEPVTDGLDAIVHKYAVQQPGTCEL